MRAFISGAGNWLNSPAGADHLIVKCITRTTPSRLMSFGYADRAILPIIKINEDYIINNHVFTAPARSAGRLHSLLANVVRLLADGLLSRGVKMKPTLNVALIAKEAAIKAAEYVSADIMAADDAYDYGAVYPMDAAIANDVYVRAAQAAYETYVKAICDANVARVAQAREVQDAIAKEREQGYA